MKKTFAISSLLALSTLLTACGTPFLPGTIQLVTPSPQVGIPSLATETAEIQPGGTQTTSVGIPSPTPSGRSFSIWVPPQFDPANGTKAGTLLKSRLDQFSLQQPGINITVRVKALDGPAGLLKSLEVARAAAPDTLPGLIILSRAQLETAAIKGLIYSLDGKIAPLDDKNWFSYARDLSTVQNSLMGLPLAGDALIIVYRPNKTGSTTAPLTWTDVLSRGQPLSFAAADPRAYLTIALYNSLGGRMIDGQGRPTLETDTLKTVLKTYADGALQGGFPVWITQFQTESQAWKVYNEGRANYAVAWTSNYLSDMPADSVAAPLPSLTDKPQTLADGWLLALAEPIPEQRALSLELANFLVDESFMAQWSAEAGYLPPRTTALAAWKNKSLQNVMMQVSLSATIAPSEDVSAVVSPILKDSVILIIGQNGDPTQVAQAAVEKLSATE